MTNNEQLESLAREFRGSKATDMFASLNLTVPQRISGSRAQMVSGHLEQAVMLEKPETPRMFTGFELPYGRYTDSYYRTEAPMKVIDVIQKFQHRPGWIYCYVVQNMVDGVYDVVEISHVEKLSEMHGYIKPVSFGDSFQPGSVIPANTVVVKSNNHDDFGNYRYGINAKVAYMSISEVEEDAQYISKSFSERVRFTTMEEAESPLNINDVLLNIYGTDDNYKCIPDLGEEVKDGMVFVKRKIDYKNIAGDFTRSASKNIQMEDQIYSGKGVVVDIDIHVNDKAELVSSKHRAQLMLYYNSIFNYYSRLKSVLSKIKNGKNKWTYRLANLLQHAKDYLDEDVKFSSANGIFEFALLKVTTAKSNPLGTGFKMTDRYGAKGVISAIVDDEFMPRDEFGNVAEIVLSPPGIPSRANIFQNYEHEMNFVEQHVRRLIANEPNIDRKYRYVMKFLKRVNKKEAESYEQYWNSLPPQEKYNEMMEISQTGIYIHQAPFNNNISFSDMMNLYKDWDIKPGKIWMRREFRDLSLKHFIARKRLEKPRYRVVNDVSFEKEGRISYLTPPESMDATPFSQNIEKDEDGEFIFPEEEAELVVDPNSKSGFSVETVDVPKVVQRLESEKETFTFIDDKGRFVREFQSVNRVVIAEKYMIILKHIPEGKYSSRSLGSTNSMGLPNKTSKSETGGPFSSTAVKFGEMELYNSLIRVDEEIVHRFLAGMATNPEFHNKLVGAILEGDPFEAPQISIKNSEIKDDTPVRQLVAYLFGIGLQIEQNDHRR